jgi:hypothetical protein
MDTIMPGFERWRITQMDYFSCFYQKAHFVRPWRHCIMAEIIATSLPTRWVLTSPLQATSSFGVPSLKIALKLTISGVPTPDQP